MNRAFLSLAAASILSALAQSHVGSGIVVDRSGQVFFQDTGSGLWKIGLDGKLSQVSRTKYHGLVIDSNNLLANSQLPRPPAGQDWDIRRLSSNPSLLAGSDWPIALGHEGSLYYQSGRAGSLRMMRTLPSGQTSVFATLPKTAEGTPLPHLNGIVARPDGSVYYSENTAIRKITPQGRISTVVKIPRLASAATMPGIGKESGPLLREFTFDAKGTIYVAAEGDGRLLKVTPDGKVTTVVQTQTPWSPTGVALFRGTIYVLEYTHTARDVRTDWLPRVRKIGPDGKQKIVATVDMMPGAR